MTIPAQVTLPLHLDEEEYELIRAFRGLDANRRRQVLELATGKNQPLRGGSVTELVRAAEELRQFLSPEELHALTDWRVLAAEINYHNDITEMDPDEFFGDFGHERGQ